MNLIENKLYGNPDGAGSDKHKSVACYKAISECLERWAYYETVYGNSAKEYGFHIDPTTTGMAAFPGFTSRAAQNTAKNEALERWAIAEWWAGHLQTAQYKLNAINYIVLKIPNTGSVVISWHPVTALSAVVENVMAYGFAGGTTEKAALLKSQIELYRNTEVLTKYFKNSKAPSMSEMRLQEQRVLWFSTEDGYQLFQEKTDRSKKITIKNYTPQLIINKEISGPWSKYARTWRCLYKTSDSYFEHENQLKYFLF